MKIRTGFVSNSSSSSFVCDVSKEIYSGWDASLSDFELYECENGHTFHEEYIVGLNGNGLDDAIRTLAETFYCDKLKPKNFKTLTNLEKADFYAAALDKFNNESEDVIDSYINDASGEIRYCLPQKYCPICQRKYVTDEDLNAYIVKKYGIDKKVLKEEIVKNFTDYKQFKDYIK